MSMNISPLQESNIIEMMSWVLMSAYPRYNEAFPNIIKYLVNKDDKTSNKQILKTIFERNLNILDRWMLNIDIESQITVHLMEEYFIHLKDVLTNEFSLNPLEFLQESNSSRIYSCKEFEFEVPFMTEGLTTYNAIISISASGKVLKPLIMNNKETNFLPDDCFECDFSINGKMNEDILLRWLKDCLEPHLDNNSIERPVILFLDGLSFLMTVPLITYVRDSGIILHCILPHSNRIMEPLTLTCEEKVKETFSTITKDFCAIDLKESFPLCLVESLESLDAEDCVAGFRQSGLLPFNPNAIDISELAITENQSEARKSENNFSDDSFSTWQEKINYLKGCLDSSKGLLTSVESILPKSLHNKFINTSEEDPIQHDPKFKVWNEMRKRTIECEKNLKDFIFKEEMAPLSPPTKRTMSNILNQAKIFNNRSE